MVAPGLLYAVLFSAGCETDQPKKTAAKVPAQATAPTEVASKTDPAAPSATAAPATVPSRQSPATDALIAQAEKLYAAGQADYQAGHLDAAKQSFDQAFNVLLSSNIEVRDNPPLEHEFDKIVEGVRQLELVALQQGDGFTEQRSEPAPIDEANDITFPIDPKVRAQAEAEIKTTKSDLPLMLNDQVAMFINYFSSTKGRHTLEHGLARAGLYREMISQTLKQEGVPQDLIYIAMAE
jgi:membrane-bound lytic murein transglycosylase D